MTTGRINQVTYSWPKEAQSDTSEQPNARGHIPMNFSQPLTKQVFTYARRMTRRNKHKKTLSDPLKDPQAYSAHLSWFPLKPNSSQRTGSASNGARRSPGNSHRTSGLLACIDLQHRLAATNSSPQSAR